MTFNRGVSKFYLLALLLSITCAWLFGCAILPTVSEMIDTVPVTNEPPQIAYVEGLLSPDESRSLMERLNGPNAPTDILRRHVEVIESIAGSRLISQNNVNLLIDGPATYSAMFDVYRDFYLPGG